jgi:hypothetical protein
MGAIQAFRYAKEIGLTCAWIQALFVGISIYRRVATPKPTLFSFKDDDLHYGYGIDSSNVLMGL